MDYSLIRQMDDFIATEGLLERNDRLLVAVSAGVDSMVLLHLLGQLEQEIGVVHANFQLRGRESELDEELVRATAESQGIPFHVNRFNTGKYAGERGISIQMAARDLRYSWFRKIMKSHGYHKLCTAHHLNDALETLLLNIAKGTGIAGLHGILPRSGSTIRPLMFTDKETIVSYGAAQGLNWREDRSNSSEYYQRNLIRHRVVPVLKAINPSLETTTRNTLEILRAVEDEYQKVISGYRKRLIMEDSGHVKILKTGLKEITPPILADIIGEYGFRYDQCKSLLGGTIEKTGKVYHSDSHVMNIDREAIIISPKALTGVQAVIDESCTGPVKIGNYQFQVSHHTVEQYQINSGRSVAAFDAEKIDFPLKVRNWLPGDRFCPLGMTNQKKLSDFFVDNKVPRNIKSEVLVLVSAEDIAWVIGHRIDDRYKVTNETRKVLEIAVETSI